MPNWCFNSLDMTGPDQDLDALLSQAAPPAGPNGDTPCGEEPFSLECLLPAPDSLSRRNEFYNEALYEWCSAHWGTKADLHEVTLMRTPAQATVAFLSAFTPPLAALKTLSARYPRLRFSVDYEEGNIFFRGTALFQGGECLEETYEEYQDDSEEDAEDDSEEQSTEQQSSEEPHIKKTLES